LAQQHAPRLDRLIMRAHERSERFRRRVGLLHRISLSHEVAVSGAGIPAGGFDRGAGKGACPLSNVLLHTTLCRMNEHGDPDHSVDEQRWVMFGLSSAGRLLIVSYVERDDTIRT